jgi:FAD/FMN-containing dehydrogenase
MVSAAPVVRDLQKALGAKAVLWRPEDLLVYEYDGTTDRAQPEVIAFPLNAPEVAEAIRIARAHDLPITPRGAGTGLSGGALAA